MNESIEKQGTAVREVKIVAVSGDGNGHHAMVATESLPIAKFVTNDQLIAEEKYLTDQEATVAKRYRGVRGYLRILHVMTVLGKLSLFLYLDQYGVHHKHHQRVARERLSKAMRLTRLAYYGEKL